MPALTHNEVMTMPRERLREFKRSADFGIDRLSMGRDARLSIYTLPVPGHLYVIGSDFAQGMEGKDFDAAVVFDKNTSPIKQVAELHGRWGPDRYDRLLYCLGRWYNTAFIVGERQFGLPVLRSLINNLHYYYLYYQRDEDGRSRARMDALGHAKIAGDATIPMYRMAIRDKQIIVRSPANREELKQFKFLPKSKNAELSELRDSDMKMGAPAGMFDDLVNAGAYGWKGICEVANFIDERPKVEEGKAGDALGMKAALSAPKTPKGKSAFRRY
jgi:hypothetical protein